LLEPILAGGVGGMGDPPIPITLGGVGGMGDPPIPVTLGGVGGMGEPPIPATLRFSETPVRTTRTARTNDNT
jgi:hypothetical protein